MSENNVENSSKNGTKTFPGIENVLKLYAENEYINNFGFQIIYADMEKFKVTMPFNGHMLNPFGSMHGGALYSVADIIGGSLACFGGNFCTTTSGNLNYLEPCINTDNVLCEATMIRNGKHLVIVNVKIMGDNNQLFAEGDFTFYRTAYKIQ